MSSKRGNVHKTLNTIPATPKRINGSYLKTKSLYMLFICFHHSQPPVPGYSLVFLSGAGISEVGSEK